MSSKRDLGLSEWLAKLANFKPPDSLTGRQLVDFVHNIPDIITESRRKLCKWLGFTWLVGNIDATARSIHRSIHHWIDVVADIPKKNPSGTTPFLSLCHSILLVG